MAIEGPITKAMNIISTAQESCPNHISQALEKVNICSNQLIMTESIQT